jgi:hypothetical protein
MGATGAIMRSRVEGAPDKKMGVLLELASRLPFVGAKLASPSLTFSKDSIRCEECSSLGQHMKWASTFMKMIPIPVCLLDKKGFIHHVNQAFSKLITIPLDGIHCPFIGRFLTHPQAFLEAIQSICSSKGATTVSIPMEISWVTSCGVNNTIMESYKWTLIGSGDGASLSLSGRYSTTQICVANVLFISMMI